MSAAGLTLAVPHPCSADWAAMPPAAQGRHCAACDKVVVDFTGMSDAELQQWFARPADRVCGRFRPGQLHRPLDARPLARRWPTWLAAGAVVFTLQALRPTEAAAQRPARPYQRLSPLLVRPQAPRPAAPAPAGSAESQAAEPLLPAQPQLLTGILGGAVFVGVRITHSEPPPRTPLLQLEDLLR